MNEQTTHTFHFKVFLGPAGPGVQFSRSLFSPVYGYSCYTTIYPNAYNLYPCETWHAPSYSIFVKLRTPSIGRPPLFIVRSFYITVTKKQQYRQYFSFLPIHAKLHPTISKKLNHLEKAKAMFTPSTPAISTQTLNHLQKNEKHSHRKQQVS